MELEDAKSKEDDLHLNNKRKPVEREPSVQGHISGSTSLTNNIIQKPSKRKQTTNVLAAGRFIDTHVATPFMNVHNSMSRSPFSDIINVIPSGNAMGNPRLEASVNKVNENIHVTPTNTNVVPNSNILTMNSTTSSLSPALALRRRGRPPKDACANKENIHTASHFNPKTFLTPTGTCVGMSSNILTPNIPPSFSASANNENVYTPSQLNPNTVLSTPSTCVGMSSNIVTNNITQSTVSPVQTKRGRGRPRKHVANDNSDQHSLVTKSTRKRDMPNSLISGVTHPIIAPPLRKPGRRSQKEAISSNNSCVVDNTTTPARTPQMNPNGTVSAPNNRSRFANKSPVHFNIETPTHDRRTPTSNRGSSNLTPSRESLKGKNSTRSAVRRISLQEDEVDSDYAYNEYTTGISADETPEHKKSRVTMREWFAYRLMDRPNVFSTILNGRRLFQQFLVDGFTMVEAERLGYVLREQKDLRCETIVVLSPLPSFRTHPEVSTPGKTDVYPRSKSRRVLLEAGETDLQLARRFCDFGLHFAAFVVETSTKAGILAGQADLNYGLVAAKAESEVDSKCLVMKNASIMAGFAVIVELFFGTKKVRTATREIWLHLQVVANDVNVVAMPEVADDVAIMIEEMNVNDDVAMPEEMAGERVGEQVVANDVNAVAMPEVADVAAMMEEMNVNHDVAMPEQMAGEPVGEVVTRPSDEI
ncbi:hypothetical protein CTI12_AA263140 [Artemisia annua]|uniref:Helitron helicase-like domain-containing protein n=1 Tax=Artemisia annua TaxID=35608 RepID=A0A2U1NI00_ARTAN|nr:hypothetical protein CTI12_AA263140 [Artemisia annua]